MSKLFKLKEWVTLPDAAKYLSLTLDEEVSQVDLLRLVLDKHLTLSVLFVNKVPVIKGKKIPFSEVQFKDVVSITDENETIRIPDSIPFSDYEPFFGVPSEDIAPISDEKLTAKISEAIKELNNYGKGKFHINLENKVFFLSGIFDLPLLRNDRVEIERLYYEQINGTELDYFNIDGTFVECCDVIYQIQEPFMDDYIKEMRKRENHSRDDEYFPAGGLPEDAALVFRTDVLREFVESFSEKKPQKENKTAETTTKNTLLKMIITMAKDGYGFDINDSKSPLHKEISDAAQKYGLSISDDTVRKWLRESAELLDQSPE